MSEEFVSLEDAREALQFARDFLYERMGIDLEEEDAGERNGAAGTKAYYNALQTIAEHVHSTPERVEEAIAVLKRKKDISSETLDLLRAVVDE